VSTTVLATICSFFSKRTPGNLLERVPDSIMEGAAGVGKAELEGSCELVHIQSQEKRLPPSLLGQLRSIAWKLSSSSRYNSHSMSQSEKDLPRQCREKKSHMGAR